MKPNAQAPAGDLAIGMRALQKVLLETYLKGLSDCNPRVRRKAARGLGNLGAAASDAVPVLETLCRDRHATVRDSARCALVKIRS
jgi:HEAT repeat protein